MEWWLGGHGGLRQRSDHRDVVPVDELDDPVGALELDRVRVVAADGRHHLCLGLFDVRLLTAEKDDARGHGHAPRLSDAVGWGGKPTAQGGKCWMSAACRHR